MISPTTMKLSRSLFLKSTLFTLGLASVAIGALAGDWPAYKHDAERSSVTGEVLPFPLRLAWKSDSSQAPSPAWPDTFRLLNRTDFDYAPHPVIAEGIVCFGSSSDDTVRALDARTGRERWHFITGGPVRFAPQIDDGKVFFASDDGFVYCVQAGTGKLVWKFQAAPRDERMIGNHRMISRWPVRTGVLVSDGVLYCVAGMWNMEGIFVHALHAETGKAIWCNDTTGFWDVTMVDFPNLDDPKSAGYAGHQGEFAEDGCNGNNPQGPLLIGGHVLVIPNGSGAPRPLDRYTGVPIATWERGAVGSGGTWLTIDGGKIYSFFTQHMSEVGIEARSVSTGEVGRVWGSSLLPQLTIAPPDQPKRMHERGKVSAIVRNEKLYARKAYGMALAGTTLLLGQDGAILAQDRDTERELWKAKVDGEAREIAVADGRVYVGTSSGAVYCFEPAGGSGAGTAAALSESAATMRSSTAGAPPPPAAAAMIKQLHEAGMDRGFALVVGDADGKVATELAARTELRVVSALTDETAAAALREQLLAQTNFYGSRVHVQTVARLGGLPFAQYFANAVIVAGPSSGFSGQELYRVLRPCGGVLLMAPQVGAAASKALLQDSGAGEKEIRQSPQGPWVVRGKLPGALDWDSNRKELTADQRVKWPLRPLWFGGPSTVQIQNIRAGATGPVVANGRYFVQGEQSLTAVDAYNGAILWSRDIPRISPGFCEVNGAIYVASDPTVVGTVGVSRGLMASDDSVYLQLGAAYFQGKGNARIQLDARTGEQKAIAGPFNPPVAVSLNEPQTWHIEVDPRHSGDIAMEGSERGLVLTLTTKDPVASKLDAWELCFDFRPADVRYGLYERGAFRARIAMAQDSNTPASWSAGTGPACLSMVVNGTREADGTKTVLVVPWSEIQKLTGTAPSSFGFAATLDSHDGGRDEPIVRRHLFGDWAADGLNNGWACIALKGSAEPADGAKPPSIIAGSPRDAVKAGGVLVGTNMREAALGTPRIHPLTGDLEPKMYRMAASCGSGYGSSVSILSGRAGIYDFADDSGLRPVDGVKTRCTTPQVVALGLLLISEETGHCACNYPVRTSVALAPAETRLNEDWAFFFARPPDTYLRQAAINLGAPGDRRDDYGTLWLGYPRLPADKSLHLPIAAGKESSVGANGVWPRMLSAMLQVPMEVECFGGADGYRPEQDSTTRWGWMTKWMPNRNGNEYGPYRINADRAGIRGTDRPWIYASGYRGIRKAVLKVAFLPPLACPRVETPPTVNGRFADLGWQGEPQVQLPFTKTDVFLRSDAENLYVAARRPAVTDRLGKTSLWGKTTSGDDANVWDDASFEVFLGGFRRDRVVHLGVSASGAKYDALAEGTADQPEDRKWNGSWKSAVTADENGMLVELVIPWQMLAAAGLKTDELGINFQMNENDAGAAPGTVLRTPVNKPKVTHGEALSYLGITGRAHCRNFASLNLGSTPKVESRLFTVRLHFAELDEVKPGERVFDVMLQGKTVLKGLDVVKEAGGVRTALVKEVNGVSATDALTMEFVPMSKVVSPATAPILSGLEVVEEGGWKDEGRRMKQSAGAGVGGK